VDANPVAADGNELLGRVVRLQVQTGHLKPGRQPRRYDPAPLLDVPELVIEPRGVRGVTADGEVIIDGHHADHPQTRHVRPYSALSVMARGDYAALRARYGSHVTDGIAGEALLIDGPGLAGRDLSAGLVVETVDGLPLTVDGVIPTTPCVEFARFCLGEEPSTTVSDDVRRAMLELRGGARGFLGAPRATGRVRAGSRVWLRCAAPAPMPAPGQEM
jgi:hypothetical protein